MHGASDIRSRFPHLADLVAEVPPAVAIRDRARLRYNEMVGGVRDLSKDETPESLFVWLQLALITATMALLETSNKLLTAISILVAVSLVSFGLYEDSCWFGTAPFFASVLLLAVAMYFTIKRIDEMDSYSGDFKNADGELRLNELYKEEQRMKAEVRIDPC